MDDNELLHESFDYHDFFVDHTDDYHTMTCVETISVPAMTNTNENLGHVITSGGTPTKNRPTGFLRSHASRTAFSCSLLRKCSHGDCNGRLLQLRIEREQRASDQDGRKRTQHDAVFQWKCQPIQ